MNRNGKRYIASKLKKTHALKKDKMIAAHIPPTKSFGMNTLHRMVRQYRAVYLKPVNGLKGRGVMRARKLNTKYELRGGTSRVIFNDFHSFYRFIVRQIGSKPYLVQKGIRMLRYHRRPFDLRVMVLKNELRNWEVAGIVGRVAPPRMIVTNRSQGGRIMSAARLLRRHMKKRATKNYLQSLYGLSRATGRQFQRVFPKVWELGVDVAISRRRRKPWILEVNTNPAITPFVKLGNRRMYSRITDLKRWNTRNYPIY
ncbi:YheC/YheD family protein [Brevibacillus sp. SYSU BS000544]|uniref:YheC/YheD family protein n=1 Tax=Brevibacillus sp. SYSU BS000544 TaxID=3416443 RepID=UPI003CE4D3AE